MKKFGILIFAAAVIIGLLVTSLFSFGRVDKSFFNISFNKKTRGSGRIATEKRDIKDFEGVNVSGTFQVEVVSQKDFGVEIEADDNLIPLIRTEVRNNILHIETEGRISTENGLKVRVSAPDIDSIEASGVSSVKLTDIDNERLKVDTSGASKINVKGETSRLDVEVSGASSVDAESLKAEAAAVNASGASSVMVFATAELRSDASGASRIIYAGNPNNVEKSTSGGATVRAR